MKEIIRKIDIFAGLDEKLLSKLADTAITSTYTSNKVIIRQGETGIGMYFILRGRVAIIRNHAGQEHRLAEIGPNHFVAEMALIDDKPRSASIVTTEETECLLFTRDTFLRLMDKHPALALRLARVLADRLRTAQDRLDEHATATATPAPLPVSPSNDATMKGNVQKKLLEIFGMLYTLKAFTRFSVAVLGCPVEGHCADAVETIRLGDVKAIVLPVTGSVELAIDAYAAGQFQLHLFHPEHFEEGPPKPLRFEPVAIQPGDHFTLTLPNAVLTRNGGAPL